MRPHRTLLTRPRRAARLRTPGVRLAAGLVGLLLGGLAQAADLDDLEAEVRELALQAEVLHEQAVDEGGPLRAGGAVRRFQDLVYRYLLGEYETAAEGFYGLVDSGALVDPVLRFDAEWYLADALFQLGNHATAAHRFQVVADDPKHPFRDDAVRRLLEIHATTGDLEAFHALYRDEIERGRVKATDVIIYSLARSFWIQGDLASAEARFREIPSSSPMYARARYHLGTFAVKRGALREATPFFAEVATIPAESPEQQKVRDLALLALGRIHYELGEYLPAAEWYARIAADSPYAADKLYEISWTFIRTQAWQDALRGIDIFLLVYPDHAYAPQMRVVKGKLHLAERQYKDALATFDEVMAEYAPVRDRFASLALQLDDPADDTFFAQVLAAARGDAVAQLPAYATSIMRSDPDLARVVDLLGTLDAQGATIRTSEDIIRKLQLVLGSDSLGRYDEVRHQALQAAWRGLEHSLALMEAELTWQRRSQGGRAGAVQSLEQRRATLAARAAERARVATARDEDLLEQRRVVHRLRSDALALRHQAEVSARQITLLERATGNDAAGDAEVRRLLLDDLRRLRGDMDEAMRTADALEVRITELQGSPGQTAQGLRLEDPDLQLMDEVRSLAREIAGQRDASSDLEVARRFDAAQLALARAQERLQQVHTALARVERAEIARIREQFEAEVVAVGQQREDQVRLLAEARASAVPAARRGFERLADTFDRSVVDADMGAVDVHWSQKLDVAREIERLREERRQLLETVGQRFDTIEQKIGPAPASATADTGDRP